jgi:hypothetical protein
MIMGAMSLFVMVQVLTSPGLTLTLPLTSQSPENVWEYPGSVVSDTAYDAGALKLLVAPEVTDVPPTNNGKSATTLVPPLSLMTVLVTVMEAGRSSLVIVQVLSSPEASVMLPLASQSPLNV